MIVVRRADLAQVRGLQQAVLRPHGPLPQDTPMPGSALHVGAFAGDRCVGAASVLPAPWPGPEGLGQPTWQLRSMAVADGHRGTGIGRRVLDLAVGTARAEGAGALWAAARVEALGFYERSGWTAVGPEWVKPGIGPHRYVTLVPDAPHA